MLQQLFSVLSRPRAGIYQKVTWLTSRNRLLLNRQRIDEAVNLKQTQGIRTHSALQQLGGGRSTYYSWRSPQKNSPQLTSVQRLTEAEWAVIIEQKQQQTQWSHRKISAYLSSALSTIQNNMRGFMEGLDRIIMATSHEIGGLALDETELHAQIDEKEMSVSQACWAQKSLRRVE